MIRGTGKVLALLVLIAAPLACDSGTDPEPEAASIELMAPVDVLPAGQTAQLQVIVEDEDGRSLPDAHVDFESSNTTLATVNANGVVTGANDGVVTITATADGVSDEVEIGIFDIGNLCENALGVVVGESVRASLQPGDCDEIVDDGSFADLWFFDLTEQQTVTVDLQSDAFDAYLWLTQSEQQGTQEWEDDDSGTGSNARVQATLGPGTYFIIANHWPGRYGPYTLSVSAGAAPDPVAGVVRLKKVRSAPGKVRVEKQ